MPVFMVRFLFVASTAVCCARAGKRTLPSVDSMLTKANSKAHDFARQAAAMQQKLVEQQAKSRAALNKQKEEYEQLLQAQSDQSQAIKTKIDDLQSGNSMLSQLNTEMMTDLQTLAGKNKDLRDALQDITSKVSAAQLFLADSLNVTDDSTAKELEVLIPATPKPTVDIFLAMTSSDKRALLVQAQRFGEGPEELVSMLTGSLADIATAEQDGAADLKARFMQSFNEGEKQQAELNETFAALEQKQSSLKEYHAKLLDAKAHLVATNTNLHKRLRAVRAFATTVEGVVGVSLRVEEAKGANNAIFESSSATAVAPAIVPATAKKTQVPALAKKTQVPALAKETQVETQVPTIAEKTQVPALAKKTQVSAAAKETQMPALAKKTQLPELAKKTQAPVFAKKTQMPALAKKTQLPALAEKTQLPALAKKTQAPVFAKKTQVPAAAKETQLETQVPTFAKKTQVPALAKKAQVPALAKKTQLPALAKETQVPALAKKTQAPVAATPTQVPVAAKPIQAFTAAKPTQAPVKKMLRTAQSAHKAAIKK